jgi:hypothetical protein
VLYCLPVLFVISRYNCKIRHIKQFVALDVTECFCTVLVIFVHMLTYACCNLGYLNLNPCESECEALGSQVNYTATSLIAKQSAKTCAARE